LIDPVAAARSDGRLPLVIVGGFLGAGKSTWLRHQLHHAHFGRAHVLVNEAAATPVDDLLLSNAQSLEVLAGGCACCEGRAALRNALLALCNHLDSATGDPVDRIVLETSGLADPGAIAAAIAQDPVLGRRIAIEKTIVLVDARDGEDQLATEPLARAQAEAADAIVVTKPGQASAGARARLAAILAQLAPGAALSWAEYGVPADIPVDQIEPPQIAAPETQAKPIQPHRLDTSGATWVAMSAWLSAVIAARGDSIVRVKGVMRTPAGRLLLQSVRKHVQPAEILPERALDSGDSEANESFLVLIGRDIDEVALHASWRRYVLAED
jgi:G3E family GTPase